MHPLCQVQRRVSRGSAGDPGSYAPHGMGEENMAYFLCARNEVQEV